MSKPLLLSAALVLALGALSSSPTQAQYGTAAPAAPVAPVNAEADQATQADGAKEGKRKRPDSRSKKASKKEVEKVEPRYPKATRKDPDQVGNPALEKQLKALFELQEKESHDEAISKADEILADARANAADKSTAAYIAGSSWMAKETDSYANAAKYFQIAIESNGLTNNNHYPLMLQLAQMLSSDEKTADALKYIDRFLSETQSEDPKAYGLKAFILYNAERYQESIDAANKALANNPAPEDTTIRLLIADYLALDKPGEAARVIEGMLAKKPNDKTLLINLASAYQEAGDSAKAGQVFDRIRSAGLMTESKDYQNAYRLLANMEGREKEALAVINEGLQKGILEPSHDVYAYQGQVYFTTGDVEKAIGAWKLAAPLSKNGETFLNLSKLQVQEEHWADAKTAAQSALAKGVKTKGEAWLVIARAEIGLGNKSGAQAAYREAAKYPESKKSAESALRQPSGK